MTPIFTVADIRKAIADRTDDELVHAQIVAADGTTWNMAVVIASVCGSPRGIVIDMRHPQLRTLPSE